MTKYIIYK